MRNKTNIYCLFKKKKTYGITKIQCALNYEINICNAYML